MRSIAVVTAGIFLSLGSLAIAAPATISSDPVPVPQPAALDAPATQAAPATQPAPVSAPAAQVPVPQPAPLDSPATQANPATQPAPVSAPPAQVLVPQPAPLDSPAQVGPAAPPPAVAAPQPLPAEGGSILVLPFVELSASANSWVGRAIQQDLVVDLVRTTRARVQAPGNLPPANDMAAAIAEGRQTGASHVVYGSLQTSGGQVRATGQVVDVNSAAVSGAFNATAPATDLFPLEDAVTNQVLHALPAQWLTVSLAPPPSASGSQSTPAPPPPAPSAVSTQEYYSYTYPDYSSAPGVTDAYPYWGYPYYYGYALPYYGPDFFFFGDFDHFHHHHWGLYGHHYGGGNFHHYGFHGYGFHGYSHAPSFHGGGGHVGGGGHGGGGHR